MDVRNRFTQAISTVPFAYTHEGRTGVIIVDNQGRGDEVFFVYGLNLDTDENDFEIYPKESMYNIFSLDLTPTDPEGVDPDIPVDPVESTRKPIFSVPNTAYKTLIDSGTYDGETRIKLSILNNEENYDVEFSTFFHGSLSGTEGNYSPNTWAVIPRETDGTYYLILPSIDNASPRPFWARFEGNTVYEFGAYVTYRTDGSDPSIEEGEGETPVTGEGDAVVRTDFQYIMNIWGGFTGRDMNRPNDEPASKTHYAEMSAVSANGNPKFKDRRPFYAYDITPRQINVPIAVDGYPFHVNEVRYADSDWLFTANDMDMSNEYLIRAGFQAWNFTYYANTYQLARFRELWEACTSKRGLKAIYTIGQLGGSRDDYDPNNPDPLNDYTINLNHIVDMMSETWYYKIDGRPVVVYFNGETETIKDINNLRKAYRVANSISNSVADSDMLYEVYMTMTQDNNTSMVTQYNLRGRTWYYQTTEETQGTHALESSIETNFANHNTLGDSLPSSFDVIPSFTVALDPRARNEYPGKTACIDALSNGSQPYWESLNRGYVDYSYSYYNAPTQSNINDMIAKSAALKTKYGSRMKFCLWSTWDENTEQNDSVMPKRLSNNTIDDSMVMWFKGQLNPSYVIPS